MFKPRTLLVAGAAAAMTAIPLVAHAGVVSSCSTSAPSTSGVVSVPTGSDGGVVWVNATASGGSAGIAGNSGYLYASGSSSGVAVLGTTASGGMVPWPAPSSGYVRAGTSPGVCYSAAGEGVQVP